MCQFRWQMKNMLLIDLSFSSSIIGLSDGLTVPFALTAGLSSIGSSRLVVTGGLAELCAGAISMGLGGYCSYHTLGIYPLLINCSGFSS